MSLADMWVIVLLTFPFSLIVYGLNDVHDYESDAINKKRHWLTGGVALPVVHRRILIGVTLAILLILASMYVIGNQLLALMMSVALVFAYIYSVPPIRLKARPVVDSVVSGVGYILVPFLIGTALNQKLLLPPEVVVMALFVTAYHMLCSVRDYEADVAVGDMTTAVWLGQRTTLWFVVMIALATALVWVLIRPTDYLAISFFIALALFALRVLYRPDFIRYAVNLMVPLAGFVAVFKLLF
jgi:4-hydroxybenzoate polyprenyltransferase